MEYTTAQIRELVYDYRQLRNVDFLGDSAFALQAKINTFISKLSENRIVFDKKDIRLSYKLCEKLIREAGCDKDGIYSSTARKAMAQICAKQHILPSANPLIDREVSFFQKAKKKFVSFAQKYLFSEANTAKGTDIKSSNKNRNYGFSFFRKIWNKAKYASATVVLILSSLSLNSGQGHAPDKNPSYGADQTAKKEIQNQKKQKILDNKTCYFNSVKQAHNDSILNNMFDTKVEIQIGKAAKNKLYHQIQSQIDKHNLKLENSISVQRFAYALTMSCIYEHNSIIQDAMMAKTPLSQAQQKALVSYVMKIGHNAVNLSKKYGTSRYSKFDHAPKNLKQKFIQNKRAVRALEL